MRIAFQVLGGLALAAIACPGRSPSPTTDGGSDAAQEDAGGGLSGDAGMTDGGLGLRDGGSDAGTACAGTCPACRNDAGCPYVPDADGFLSCGTDLSTASACPAPRLTIVDAGYFCPNCQVLFSFVGNGTFDELSQDQTTLYGWGFSTIGIPKNGAKPFALTLQSGPCNDFLTGARMTSICGALVFTCAKRGVPYTLGEARTPCGTSFELSGVNILGNSLWDGTGLYVRPGSTLAMDWQGNTRANWNAGLLGAAQDPAHLYFVDDDGSGSLIFQVAWKSDGGLSLLLSMDGGTLTNNPAIPATPYGGLTFGNGTLYWSGTWAGDSGIWSLGVADGGPPVLAMPGCFGPPQADLAGVYAIDCTGTVVRVDGGVVKLTPPGARTFVVDSQFLYWDAVIDAGIEVIARHPK